MNFTNPIHGIRIGFNNVSKMYTNANKPDYYNKYSSHLIFSYLIALLNSILIFISTYIIIDFHKKLFVSFTFFLIALFMQIFIAFKYLKKQE